MSEDQVVVVKHQPEKSRFIIDLDGECAGYARYKVLDDGVWDFYSTVIDPKFEGKGLGSKLVNFALDYAEEAGKKARGTCPFVAVKIDRRAQK